MATLRGEAGIATGGGERRMAMRGCETRIATGRCQTRTVTSAGEMRIATTGAVALAGRACSFIRAVLPSPVLPPKRRCGLRGTRPPSPVSRAPPPPPLSRAPPPPPASRLPPPPPVSRARLVLRGSCRLPRPQSGVLACLPAWCILRHRSTPPPPCTSRIPPPRTPIVWPAALLPRSGTHRRSMATDSLPPTAPKLLRQWRGRLRR